MSRYCDNCDSDVPCDCGDPDAEPMIGREGCLFGPSVCLMPGPHFTSECHTAEMVEALPGGDE